MEETAPNGAVKTDPPSPKPNRRKRLALRFAALVVAVSALGVAYWFTRPPELIWWRSPEIGSSSRHVHVLIPKGWKLNLPADVSEEDGDWSASWAPTNADHTPTYIRRLFQFPTEVYANMLIAPAQHRDALDDKENNPQGIRLDPWKIGCHQADPELVRRDLRIRVELSYQRNVVSAFNRTYRQICNSLRIE